MMSALLDPKGPLAEEVDSSLIAAANKDVLDILEKPVPSKATLRLPLRKK